MANPTLFSTEFDAAYQAAIVAVNDPTGFANNTDSTINFNDATGVFTIAPTGTSYDTYQDGVKYTHTTAETLSIANTNGVHVIFFHGDVLSEVVNPTANEITVAIKTLTLISILYVNTTLGEAIYVGDERHGLQMDGSTHNLIHWRDGLTWLGGLTVVDMSVDGSGVDVDAEAGVSAGMVSDEDLAFHIDAIASTTGFPVFYMLGSESDPLWYRTVNAKFFCRTVDDTSSTLMAYNHNNSGTWELADAGARDFNLYHLFATTDPDQPIISIMGQSQYDTKNAARDGAEVEMINLTVNRSLAPEMLPIATIIMQTKSSYTNDVNARAISTDSGDDYIDWRGSFINHIPTEL